MDACVFKSARTVLQASEGPCPAQHPLGPHSCPVLTTQVLIVQAIPVIFTSSRSTNPNKTIAPACANCAKSDKLGPNPGID